MREIWKDISGYEGIYQISNLGNVCSNSGLRKQRTAGKGYKSITLHKNGSRNYFFIHRLVAEHFISNPNHYEQVNHIDGNKENNCVNNLEWCNNSQNMKHAYNNGLHSKPKTVLQFDKKGNFIKKWNTISEIYISFGIKENGYISAVCKHKRKSAYGFVWKYAEGE